MGTEPALLGSAFVFNTINFVKALNWYNYYFTIDSGRKYIQEYMVNRGYGSEQLKLFEKTPDKALSLYMCSVSRMINMGCQLPPEIVAGLEERIIRCISSIIEVKKEEETYQYNKSIADIDDIIDGFVNSNMAYFAPGIYELLTKNKATKVQVANAILYYQPLLEELIDPDPEYYDHLTKKQIRAYQAFIAHIIEDAERYVHNKAVTRVRKPRKKKQKSAQQLTSKVKYCKEFAELKLASINPCDIIGATVLWVYNTKYRRLYCVGATKGKTFNIKGTTLENFCAETSSGKTLRKPADTLTPLLNTGKVSMRNMFTKIKSKESPFNGRINKDMVLLKVFK